MPMPTACILLWLRVVFNFCADFGIVLLGVMEISQVFYKYEYDTEN